MPDPTPPSRRRRSARRDQGPAGTAPNSDDSAQPTPTRESGASHDAVIPPHPPINRMPPPRTEPPTDEGGPAGPLRAMRMRRRPRRQPDPEATAADQDVPPGGEPPPPSPRPRDRRVDTAERALRGLVTTRGTQISWSAATRARVYAEPTPADLAAAEEEIVLVRRNYTPSEPLRSGRGPVPRQRGPGAGLPGPPGLRHPPGGTDEGTETD